MNQARQTQWKLHASQKGVHIKTTPGVSVCKEVGTEMAKMIVLLLGLHALVHADASEVATSVGNFAYCFSSTAGGHFRASTFHAANCCGSTTLWEGIRGLTDTCKLLFLVKARNVYLSLEAIVNDSFDRGKHA